MPAVPFFGTYGRFEATERAQNALLMSADALIGDEVTLSPERAGSAPVIWLDNRFGGRLGRLDAKTAEQVALCQAKGWTVRALLASVWQTHVGEGADLWGEVVILAYPAARAGAFDVFTGNVASMLAQGIRPEVDLQQASVSRIEESNGSWVPTGRRAPLSQNSGVLLKDQLSLNDKMVEAARDRNPGCMIAGWLYIAALVALALFVVKSLLGL